VKRYRLPILSIIALFLAGNLMTLAAADHAFVGVNKCKPCHLKEWQSWSNTNMAKAFEILAPGQRSAEKTAAGLDPRKDYRTDSECLACHVTGYGKPGGFKDIATTPHLAGVGCEMCHGAGATYIKPEHMSLNNKEYKKRSLVAVGLVGEITISQCEPCHNSRSPFVGDDYKFDFEATKKKGTHEKFPLKYKH